MKADIRDKLIAALESGKYLHGRGQLKIVYSDEWDEDGEPIGEKTTEHCCLGVLCELAIEEGILDAIPDTSDDDFRMGLYLPEAVEEWAELPYAQQEELASKNDESGSYGPVIEMIKAL